MGYLALYVGIGLEPPRNWIIRLSLHSEMHRFSKKKKSLISMRSLHMI